MIRILTVCLVLCLSVAAWAVDENPKTKQDVVRAMDGYFFDLKGFKAAFTQTTSNHSEMPATGTISFQKTGKLRIDYDPPIPYQIVANGLWLIYNDKELEQVTHVPVNETPARFLLDDEVNLEDNFDIKSVQINDDYLEAHLLPKKDIGATDLILGFARPRVEGVGRKKLELSYWVVKDLQGVETKIQLQDVERNPRFPKNFFSVVNPKFFKPR